MVQEEATGVLSAAGASLAIMADPVPPKSGQVLVRTYVLKHAEFSQGLLGYVRSSEIRYNAALIRHTHSLRLWETMTYLDVFDRSHEMTFCAYLDKSLSTFNMCNTYNNAN